MCIYMDIYMPIYIFIYIDICQVLIRHNPLSRHMALFYEPTFDIIIHNSPVLFSSLLCVCILFPVQYQHVNTCVHYLVVLFFTQQLLGAKELVISCVFQPSLTLTLTLWCWQCKLVVLCLVYYCCSGLYSTRKEGAHTGITFLFTFVSINMLCLYL